ncbi:MAG TPA: ATP-dependent sacrificial sulfur transferase LarE [Thermoanaerobaculia bacterium]|nr:ATP-dependent sacrificial sulfur transferase LarE [Thermoanaerobaculia bacterium]HUM30716.1 ATP-dependent sacrificial sulfur transferase LarE [Thermoanaerobaculia bacterium]HXK68995.1 ATP-dependent sacrificial sulfur transferase LarE [Thermoanaerobaculia bacterium]
MSEPTKLMKLERVFHDMKNVAVSYSGGVDSTFLLAVAARVLGADHVMAITILSDITPPWDIGFATSFAGKTGVNHTVIEAHDKIDHPEFKVNSPKRCYHCKLYNHERIQAVLPEGYTLVSGTNASDTGGDRPGVEAEAECGVRQPLLELGFTKDDIRLISRELGIRGWDRPSSACLASRIPHGTPIDRDELARVRDAELFLRDLGYAMVRVRAFPDGVAKIELPEGEITAFLKERERIAEYLRQLGFKHVTLDLEGYIPAGIKYLEKDRERSHPSGN